MTNTFDNGPDITDQMLVKLAGRAAFERGEDYFHDGAVSELAIRGSRVKASVSGSHVYQVSLTYNQQGLNGFCDCPASEGMDFCKHCVAAAMTLREQLSKPVVKKTVCPSDVLTDYLQKQDAAWLVQQLAAVINSDKTLRQQWLIKAENDLGLLDKKVIRKRITAAIPTNRHYHRYDQVRQYFATIEQLFEQLSDPIRRLPAAERIELLDYAFERIGCAMATVDDSGGFRFNVINDMQSLYVEAFGEFACSDDEKAGRLLELLLQADDMHGEIPGDYIARISAQCLDLFYDKVRQYWSELPVLTTTSEWNAKYKYYPLLNILAAAAEAENNVAELIVLHRKVATCLNEYLRLAKWSIDLKRYEDAQRYVDLAADGKHSFSYPAVHDVQQQILLATGREQEALEQQWQAFCASPGMKNFNALNEFAAKAVSSEDWSAKAINWLVAQTPKSSSFARQQVLDCLLLIYLDRKEIEKAWELAQNHGFATEHMLTLAKHLHHDLPRATKIYTSLIEHHIRQTNNDHYRMAIKLLQDLETVYATAGQSIGEMLQWCRVEFRNKRNFIKWLNEAFPVS